MSNIYFTTPQAVKNNSAIQDNVDDNLIAPFIYKAQFIHVHQLLGTCLYEKLLSDVESKSITGNYKVLLEKYVIPCLIEWTTYEVMPFISLTLDNKSITKGKSDYSDAADLTDLKFLQESVRTMAMFYNQRVIEYLKANTSLFPEYLDNTSLSDIKPMFSQNLLGGIYVGKNAIDCDIDEREYKRSTNRTNYKLI